MGEFVPMLNATLAPGMVIRLNEHDIRYLRITHVFADSVYVMWVGDPEEVRRTRRPKRKTLSEIEEIVKVHGGTLGQLTLPPALSSVPADDSERARALESAWVMISSVIKALDNEANLDRSRFTSTIREQAKAAGGSFTTFFRLILRYYYFGRTRLSLLKLPPGTKPGKGYYMNIGADSQKAESKPKRRGRKPALAKELGPNDFIVSAEDINDMVQTFRALLRKGPAYKSSAHEYYLAGAFCRRHPELHADYIAGTRIEPVTSRQYSYYIDRHAQLSDRLADNLRTYRRNKGHLGSLYAAGPGEVYEIDSTGGRLYLVTAGENPIHVGKPTIYLMVDRWSRFVVSAYISLKSPSYEEVRHALLVAFTSRERRFRALGIDIDDERWPIGHMPAVICPDRGSEFMSNSMEQAVVSDLRIELTPLPPYCPDGKAIVERLIREVKRRMAGGGMKGTYADRPLTPETKRTARSAKTAAAHSLAHAYRVLIEIIHDHNNRPHTALKRMRILTQASVHPSPKAAYLWGLINIVGLRKAPFSDGDYKRLLLATDTASIASGVLRYRGRPYLPLDETSIDIAKKSTNHVKQIIVRVDKTDPHELFVATSQGTWACFGITGGGQNEISGLTLDEEESLASHTSLLWAKTAHESRLGRVASLSSKPIPTSAQTKLPKQVSNKTLQSSRSEETTSVKRALTQTHAERNEDSVQRVAASPLEWEKIEEEERLGKLKAVRKHRRKR